MGFFISDYERKMLNEEIKIEAKCLSKLVKVENDIFVSLRDYKKKLFPFLFQKWILNLEAQLESVRYHRQESELKLEVLSDISIMVNELNASLYTGNSSKSIFEKTVYQKCVVLYRLFRMELLNIISSNSIDDVNLVSRRDFIRDMVDYYESVIFQDLSFDYYVPESADDALLYEMYVSYIDLVCDCIASNVSYEDFVDRAKHYLSFRDRLSAKGDKKENFVRKRVHN